MATITELFDSLNSLNSPESPESSDSHVGGEILGILVGELVKGIMENMNLALSEKGSDTETEVETYAETEAETESETESETEANILNIPSAPTIYTTHLSNNDLIDRIRAIYKSRMDTVIATNEVDEEDKVQMFEKLNLFFRMNLLNIFYRNEEDVSVHILSEKLGNTIFYSMEVDFYSTVIHFRIRYSELLELYNHLVKKEKQALHTRHYNRCVYVPPFPPKLFIFEQTKDNLEDREEKLQDFMEKVMSNSYLRILAGNFLEKNNKIFIEDKLESITINDDYVMVCNPFLSE
jgi:hypothetical protein